VIEVEMNDIKLEYRVRYQWWRLLEHILGKGPASTRFASKRLEVNELASRQLQVQGFGKSLEIPRIKNLSDSDFKRNFLHKGLPVVMEGKAKEWNCTKTWSPQWLSQHFGSDPVSLIDASPEDMTNINYEVQNVTLGDVLKAMDSGDISKYSRFNRILYDHPELLADFDWRWLYKMRNVLSSGNTFQVFIGGKGTRTQLHCASEHNLFTQVYGQKHWYIYEPACDIIFDPPVTGTPYFHSAFDPDAPDYSRFPGAQFLNRWECELSPGDVLFNPPSWWHHVTNLTGSIGVGFRWFGAIDCFKISFMQALLTVGATNPPIWVAAKNRTDFASIFSYMNAQRLKREKGS